MTYRWHKISTPFEDDGRMHEVVVVGSGYGGGVAAARLAHAGRKVTVLERGREVAPGEYPRDPVATQEEFQIKLSRTGTRIGKADGLYDLRINDDVNVLLGCGLGGTSLINANVAIEPDPVIYKSWPKVFKKDPGTLDPYFDMAREMLGSRPYPQGKTPKKMAALQRVAEGLDAPFVRPDINVSFEDGFNAAGVLQAACTDCGDCVAGCNYGAKNTVLMNYLPFARKHGARLMTGAEVRSLRRSGKHWKLVVHDLACGQDVEIKAKFVILAAGSLGSTEILLRSDPDRKLFSKKLGQGFSGNGDIWAFGYNANYEVDGQRADIWGVGAGLHDVEHGETDVDTPFKPGPCITGMVDLRKGADPKDHLIIEEGVMPGALAAGYAVVYPMLDVLMGDPGRFGDTAQRMADLAELGTKISDAPLEFADSVYSGPVSRTMSFLVMSHDRSDGELELRADSIAVKWEDEGGDPSIVRNNDVIRQASDVLQAQFLPNPFWQDAFNRRLVAVHPLGGCQMADTVKKGVVNDACQVFDRDGGLHDGLFVCDGAVVPGSVGVNPHLTITALAERAMALLIREQGWSGKGEPLTVLTQPDLDAPQENLVSVLEQVIGGLEAMRQAIDLRMYELVRNMMAGLWRRVLEALASKTLKPKDPFPLPSVDTFLDTLGDAVSLQTIVDPILGQMLDVLEPLVRDLKAGRMQNALDGVLEQMGDFSPPAKFYEKMDGWISNVGLADSPQPSDPYEVAAQAGTACRFEADIRTGAVHGATSGSGALDIRKGMFTSEMLGDYKVGRGTFEFLISAADKVDTWNMIYTCPLTPKKRSQGPELTLRGVKTLRHRPGSHWWRDLNELDLDILDGETPVARGRLVLGHEDLLIQANGLEVGYSAGSLKLAAALVYSEIAALFPDGKKDKKRDLPALFQRTEFRTNLALALIGGANEALPDLKVADKLKMLFGGLVFLRMGMLALRTYGGFYAYMADFPAREAGPGPLPTPPRLPKPEIYWPEPEPGVYVKLTRYNGSALVGARAKGPVMLAGGFGTRASSFATPTVDMSLTEMLFKAGYDVWLFDYRGNGEIAASQKPFNLDDVAQKDWPAAISTVCRVTGHDGVDVVAHCIGSMTLFMAMLANEKRVRSVLASQLATHTITNWLNYAKADSGLADIMVNGLPEKLWGLIDLMDLPPDAAQIARHGFDVLDPCSPAERLPDANLDNVMDAALWKVPAFAPVPCQSPTCHRINAIFGPSYNHDQLNQETHNAIRHMFGPLSPHPGQHIAKIYATGHVVSADGSFDYMANYKNLRVPIHFIAGALNQEMLPEASLRTLTWLREKNGTKNDLYSRHVFPDYGHMDCFIGKNAARDIFPHILGWLDARTRDRGVG